MLRRFSDVAIGSFEKILNNINGINNENKTAKIEEIEEKKRKLDEIGNVNVKELNLIISRLIFFNLDDRI